MASTQITGLILAGGQSRRMGGGDKGLLDLAGRPMLAHVIGRLRPQVGRMVINANGDPARFAVFGLPVVPDTIEGFVGPLAGVLAGLRWSAANAPDATHIATVSADAPFFPADLVARLGAALKARTTGPLAPSPREGRERGESGGEGSPQAAIGGIGPHPDPLPAVAVSPGGERGFAIALAASAGEVHPVIGLWPVALADDLEAALTAGVRKVLAWTDRHGTVPVEFPHVEIKGRRIDPFFNTNTPEELDEARALLQ